MEQTQIASSFIRALFKDALKNRRHMAERLDATLEANESLFQRVAHEVEVIRKMYVNAIQSSSREDIATVKAEIAKILEDEQMLKLIDLEKGFTATHPVFISLPPDNQDDIADAIVKKLWEQRADSTQKKMAPVVELPSSARWEDIEIFFQKGQEVRVRCKGILVGTYTYQQLGLAKTKAKAPDVHWDLLQSLALCYEFKTVPPTKDGLMRQGNIGTKSANALEKRKSTLSKKLRAAFGIYDEPFLPYDPKEGYRVKFTLRPDPVLRGDGEVHRSGISFKDDTYNDDE